MRVVTPVQLTRIVSPVNPLAADADRHAVAWAKQNRLVTTTTAASRLAAIMPGTLAAHCYPSASENDLFLLADWMTWLFSLDDQNDEGSYARDPNALGDLLTHVFFAAVKPGDTAVHGPLAMSLQDIFGRVGDRMSASWRHRFLQHVGDYFTANIWQAAHRRTADIPDLDTFGRMRRDAGAIIPSFDLIEFVASTTIPVELYYGRVYQRLLTSAANVVCWTNDLLTLQKELAHNDMQNLVPVLAHSLGVSLDDSVAEVSARAGRQVELFLAAEAELESVFDALAMSDDLRAATVDCVGMLRAWMRGHVEWGQSTARYLEAMT